MSERRSGARFWNGWRRGYVVLGVAYAGYVTVDFLLPRLNANAVALHGTDPGGLAAVNHGAEFTALVLWGVTMLLIYAAGAAVAWVRRGFRRSGVFVVEVEED